MTVAFATFDEPYAWLIRGLVEYGWPDVSSAGGQVPPGVPGGIDLRGFTRSEGREGIVLRVPAVAGGRRCDEDGAYDFQLLLNDEGGSLRCIVRCPEAGFIQELPYDPANPLHAAGYAHQAVTGFVPQFVQWRLGGNELGLTERRGIPEFAGLSCSPALAAFVAREIGRVGRGLHMGAHEGWWIGASPGPGGAFGGPGAVQGGSAPVGKPITVAVAGRVGLLEAAGPNSKGAGAFAAVAGPALGLKVASVLVMVLGMLFGCANIATVLTTYGLEYIGEGVPAACFSFVVLFASLLAGWIGISGAGRYRRLEGGPLVYAGWGVLALAPGCCGFGLPLVGWAAYVWFKPEVKEVWSRGS